MPEFIAFPTAQNHACNFVDEAIPTVSSIDLHIISLHPMIAQKVYLKCRYNAMVPRVPHSRMRSTTRGRNRISTRANRLSSLLCLVGTLCGVWQMGRWTGRTEAGYFQSLDDAERHLQLPAHPEKGTHILFLSPPTPLFGNFSPRVERLYA